VEAEFELMDPVRNAERDILRYLIAHRDARDTVEGIEKWWLPPSKTYATADVGAALRNLEEANLIKVWNTAFAPALYGRAQTDSEALERYLSTLE
jgi:hypothetical protein